MQKSILAGAFAALLATVTPAIAQTRIAEHGGVITTTQTRKTGKQIEKVTCREFLAIDNRFKPQAVSYAIGYNKAKKPEDAVFDVTGIDRLVPVVVQSCRARPEQTLLQRIRADFHKL